MSTAPATIGAGGARPAGEPRLPPFFPRAPDACKDVAKAFFVALTAESKYAEGGVRVGGGAQILYLKNQTPELSHKNPHAAHTTRHPPTGPCRGPQRAAKASARDGLVRGVRHQTLEGAPKGARRCGVHLKGVKRVAPRRRGGGGGGRRRGRLTAGCAGDPLARPPGFVALCRVKRWSIVVFWWRRRWRLTPPPRASPNARADGPHASLRASSFNLLSWSCCCGLSVATAAGSRETPRSPATTPPCASNVAA